MYVKYGNQFAEILDSTGHTDEAAAVRAEVAEMEHTVLTAGWDAAGSAAPTMPLAM